MKTNAILLSAAQKKELEKIFNVSRITVWQALTGKSASPKAKRIRQAALEMGGKFFPGNSAETSLS